jgi:phage-related protein (TIGR01555 family)
MLDRVSSKHKPIRNTSPKKVRVTPWIVARDRLHANLLKQRERRQAGQTDLFKPALNIFPPEVGPKVDAGMPKLAMDDNMSSTLSWAQNAIQSTFAEGLTFLGYAFLAQLAQRPEYRRAAEILAEEMTRKWIKLQSISDDIDKTEQIKELNDELDRFKVKDHFRKLAEDDNYFGRAHLYVDTGDTDNPEELKTSIGTGRDDTSKLKIKRGMLKGFKTVEPVWCYPTNYNSFNPLKGDWYNPEMWYVVSQQMHATRLLKFVCREVPDLLKPAYAFGGLSLSQMGKPYVDNWLRTRQSIADLIHSFSVFVLKTQLASSMQDGGEEFFERLNLFVSNRDNQGVMAIDKDTEDFGNVSASIAGLEGLQAQTQEHMCAIFGIPTIKYLAIQPAGFNASSEGEIQTFYDTILALQERFFRPNLTRVLDFTMLHLWGEVDQEITFGFEPLWSLDEEKMSTVRKTDMDTDVAAIDAGIISPAESRKRVAADANSPYSSIDVDDLPEPPAEEGVGEGGMEGEGGEETENNAPPSSERGDRGGVSQEDTGPS